MEFFTSCGVLYRVCNHCSLPAYTVGEVRTLPAYSVGEGSTYSTCKYCSVGMNVLYLHILQVKQVRTLSAYTVGMNVLYLHILQVKHLRWKTLSLALRTRSRGLRPRPHPSHFGPNFLKTQGCCKYKVSKKVVYFKNFHTGLPKKKCPIAKIFLVNIFFYFTFLIITEQIRNIFDIWERLFQETLYKTLKKRTSGNMSSGGVRVEVILIEILRIIILCGGGGGGGLRRFSP